MPFARIPGSERYDRAAAKLVGEALARPGRWHARDVKRPRAGSRLRALLEEAGIGLDATDAGGLTAWERAFQRAAYHALAEAQDRNRPAWSMQRRWGPRHAGGRFFAVRISPAAVGYRAAARKPAAERYTSNPRLRSGGEGSGRERF